MLISGWGQNTKNDCNFNCPRNICELKNELKNKPLIARGNGRSYGDSSLNKNNTISMLNFNHFINFNPDNGLLVLESGVLLKDIIETFLPKGWFPSVSPGTKFATVGGMLAADVHGKNHHKEGSIRNFVDWIELLDNNGNIVKCSSSHNKEIFNWTIGGMGLTGIILKAAIKLRKVETGWIKQKIIATSNLRETMKVFDKYRDTTYSVAWIDCTKSIKNVGRSLIIIGEHAKKNEINKNNDLFNISRIKQIYIPPFIIRCLLNFFTIKLLNKLYYFLGKTKFKSQNVTWDDYFYPLDKIVGWNKFYGKKGFIQFQCVLPLRNSEFGIEEILKTIAKSKQGSFLAVLKKFSKQNVGLSFPMLGYTIALDFPVTKKTVALINILHKITIKYEGRVYLAKDSILKYKDLRKLDSRLNDFLLMRKKTNNSNYFISLQSKRLKI